MVRIRREPKRKWGLGLCLLLASVLGAWVPARAQAHNDSACAPNCYISPSGDDCTGTGTQASPWRTPFKCFNEVHAGGTCWMADGDYPSVDSSDYGGFGWVIGLAATQGNFCTTRTNSAGGNAGSPIVFRGVNPGAKANWTVASGCHSLLRISGSVNHLKFQNMTFKSGRFFIGTTPHDDIEVTQSVIRHTPTSEDGSNVAMFASGNNNGTYLTNVWIHDNLFLFDAGDENRNCGQSPQNPEFMAMYSLSDGSVIERNDFRMTANAPYLSNENFIGLKATAQHVKIRNNYMRNDSSLDIRNMIWLEHDGNAGSLGGNDVYNNILHGKGTGMLQENLVHYDKIYNNTFYNVTLCYDGHGSSSMADHAEFFNNICTVQGSRYIDVDSQGYAVGKVADQTYWNNNLYYRSGGAGTFGDQGATYSGIVGWLAHLVSLPSVLNEVLSREANPLLVDPANGNYKLQALSPALIGGRGGSYATALGAYVSGSETIGCTFDPRCLGYSGGSSGTGGVGTVDGVERTDTH